MRVERRLRGFCVRRRGAQSIFRKCSAKTDVEIFSHSDAASSNDRPDIGKFVRSKSQMTNTVPEALRWKVA
jgi:hypothetical protein